VRHDGLIWMATALLVTMSPGSPRAAEPADGRSDYGVSLAMTGEESRAESLFITMLSHTRGDSRALNNLGNIRLLKGETGVALAFYERALRGDSLDPGIHLNRATALMVIGEKERSAEAFARGVKLAGGLENAQALLGLPPDRTASDRTASDRTASDRTASGDRAAQKTMIDPEQLRQMLRTAAKSVPSEPASRTARTARTASAWRSAGPRGADGSDTSHLLYWKR